MSCYRPSSQDGLPENVGGPCFKFPGEPTQIKSGNEVVGLNVKTMPYSVDIKGKFVTFDSDGMPTTGTIESMEVFSLAADGTVGSTALAGNTSLSINWTDFTQILPHSHSSKIVINDVIYNEGANTLEFVAGADKFTATDPREYNLSQVTLTINGTPTTLDAIASDANGAMSVSSSGANAGNLVIALMDADREVAVQNLDDATPDNIIVGAGFNAGVSSLSSKPIAVMLAPKVTVRQCGYDAASKTLEFVAGTDKFDPNVAVRDYDMSKVTLTINDTATADQLKAVLLQRVLLLLVLTQVILLSLWMKELQVFQI